MRIPIPVLASLLVACLLIPSMGAGGAIAGGAFAMFVAWLVVELAGL